MADRISVILFKDRAARGDRARLEQQLIAALTGRPEVELYVIPHLYDLAADGPGTGRLRSIADDLIVLAWLYPRAAFWVLDANHVRGRLGRTSSLPDEEPDIPSAGDQRSPADGRATRVNAPDVPDRTIWCLDLRAHERAEPFLEDIARIVEMVVGPASEEVPSATAGGTPSSGEAGVGMPTQSKARHPSPAGERNEIDEVVQSRWYPVIDYGRCTNCMECLNFCIFGVFGLDAADVIWVEQPDACRPGCPACARVCPAGAIMFPQHQDPAIAGDPAASPQALKLDLSQLFGGATPAELAAAERDRALAERAPADLKSPTPPTKDDLDRLVDDLDDLDL